MLKCIENDFTLLNVNVNTRNEFDFLDIHQIMKVLGHMQSRCGALLRITAWDPVGFMFG